MKEPLICPYNIFIHLGVQKSKSQNPYMQYPSFMKLENKQTKLCIIYKNIHQC